MKLENKDIVYDKSLDIVGVVMDDTDSHNIHVGYENNMGGGLYCIVKDCDEYDKSLIKLDELKN